MPPAGDGRQDAGPVFRPVDVVPVRREGDLEDRVPVVLGRDYEVGFEEVVGVFSGDESVPDGQGGVAGQPGGGQAVLVQGGVGGPSVFGDIAPASAAGATARRVRVGLVSLHGISTWHLHRIERVLRAPVRLAGEEPSPNVRVGLPPCT